MQAILIKIYGLVRIHDMLHLKEYLQLSDNFTYVRTSITNELRRKKHGEPSAK